MTLSLNPTLTQEKDKEQNKEIQVNNIDIVTQHKPMPQLQAQNTADLNTQDNNTESSINAQEPIGQTPNTTQDFDINNKEYQEFVKEFLTTKQAAKDHYDLKYSKDLLKQSVDKFEITQLANPLFIANNIKDMGREGIEFFNKSGDQIKKSETELYDYLAKTGISHEMLGIKNFDEQKLKDAHTRQGLRGKTEYKQLNEEEKDYLKRGQNWVGALWDKVVHSEEKRVEELLRNDTRRYIDPDLLTDLIKIDSAYSSVLNVMKSSETATQDLQKKLKEMDIKAKERGYAAAVYDKKAKALAIIDKQGKKYYLDEDGVTANLDKIIVNNWNDILLSSIPVGGWGVKGAGIALKNAGFKGLGKEAAKAGAISFAASPLDYVTLRNEVGGEIDTKQMLEFSAGNALGSAAGVMAIGTLAKGAGKAYNSIKDLKNLSTDDLKNIKISKYLDNEEASIHRKLAKFNKSEIDSNYEIFKNLQSDRVISKEMKDPTFMGNFMDKISDYNVLKHLSSKKESQDKLLSALFSNKELAREFAGKLTSEEAAIVNKAIHAMGENFTRLSKEYEQQIIDEYAKSGKIKGLNPHTESSPDSVMLSAKHETSNTNANKDVSATGEHDKIESKSIQEVINIIETSPQKGRDMEIIGEANFTPQIIEYAHKNNKKIAIDKLSKTEAEQLGFKYADDVRVTIDYQAINHTLNRHGVESNLVKQSGQKPVEYSDIANYRNIAKTANETFFSKDDLGQDVILSFKQINGHAIIVESIRKKGNELAFKSMYFEKGSYKNSKAYKDVVESQKANHFQAPYGYEPHADANTPPIKADNHIIPQNLPEVYKHMLDEIDKQAKQDYKTSIDNLQNALNDIDFKATLLQGYKQVTDDAIDSLGLDNQLTNTLIRETQKLESKPNISLAEAIELRKNINEIMRNYEKSSSDLKKFRANKHLDNIKDNIDNAIKNALDSKVAQNEANQMSGVQGLGRNEIEISPLTRQEADELFSNFQQANKNYAQIKESLNDKFAKALTKGMNKKDLDSRLTIEQWKQRVLDTQWGDSVKGLENTIFKNFNPRMQKHTQMLTILRALDRNVKLNDDSMPIYFTKILSDIENLEKLTLHPEIYPILDTFKSYAKSYQFAQEISKAKALENKLGGGALATTLEGRIKVFLTNRLFKKLFAFIPYIGDNAAITKALQSAIKDLKYPSEITLETLKVLNKADLDKGFKPIRDKENKPRFEYKANTPLSDKELQSQIRGNTQILTPKDTSEIEALASNPLIQNMERQAKYNEELTQKISQFEANKENIQQDILNNLIVATQEIKQNTELLKQLAQQLTHNNPIHTPNKSIIKAQIDNETYFITTDKNNITAIEKQELQNLAQPKTYDELMQRDKNENATLESYRDQYADIAEIKEAQAQKQLLLEYKPEIKETSTSIDNTQIKSIQEIINIIETSPQKGRDMQIIGEANFTPQAVEYAHKNNKKIAIDKLDEAEAQRLGFKHPQDVRVTIDSSAINHTLNRHGVESDLVKQSGQKPVEYSDIANYRNITKTADETLNSVDNVGTPVIVSYKQVNGHFVAVEEIRKKQNELSFKTMFKQEGNYKDSESYKKTSQNSNATEGYEPTANSFALTKKGYKPDLSTPNETIPQTKPYEVNENGRKYTEIPDDELADFEKSIKQALLLEPRQQELLKKINADSKDIDSYAEFMTNERKIMKGHEFTFNQQQEGLADRFLNMANSLENPRDRNHYAENILANMKDDIEKLYKSNASEFLAREAEKPFYKQMDKIRKETDEIVEALNKERDRLHAEKEAQLKAQQETEKAAEIERIANYDLETAYKEKAHLEKIMQSNRSDYAPYSFSSAYNSEFLDKLDLVEQRIRDLKNKLPNKTPQENKPSKVEALKDFIDNARFQVNYAKKAKGTDTALKLIQQMIKDTNNTYEAKFLYRLKNEISALKGTESSTQINKDSVMLSGSETSHLNGNKDVLALPQHDKGINQYDKTKETFTDSYGKTHEIPKDIADNWKNTFNLKSLDEAYIPSFTPEVKQALDSILQGEDIKLYAGSLVKLMQRDRLEFLPYIKDTLEHSDIIIKDKENAIIFAKDIGQTSYFTSVSKNDKGEWVISTNSYKTLSQLKNRVNDNGEILYISKEAPNILAETFTTKAFSNELANAIIPQTPQEIIKQARKSGKSVKETKELLQKHNKEIQSIRTEIRKDIATRQKNIEQGYIDIVSSHHAKIGKKGGYTTKMYLETDKEKQSYLYDGFNKESVDNYLQLVKENAPLKERNKALDKLVNERLEAEERFSQLQKQQEELEDKQLQAFDEESFIKSLEGKSKDELENIQGDLWNKSRDKNSDTPFPVIARMSNLVMWIQDKIPQAAFNNDELREAIKSLRTRKEYKDDINSIQYFKKNREYIEQTLNIKPIKEFGTNYAEHYHSGESAIQKLINEAQAHKESGAKGEYKGQVAGAFHRKELGDIDLVWGEVTDFEKHKGYGLAHILDKRKSEFIEQGLSETEADKAIKSLLDTIPHILDKGRIYRQNADKIEIITDKYTLVVGLRNDRKLIITELIDRRNKKRLEAMQTGVGDSFTDEPLT